MDITQALKDTENALRDFISLVLSKKHGNDWIKFSGVSEDRLKVWKERKKVEKKKQESGVTEERLIYYADFYDLKTILKKNWNEFSDALGGWKTIEVWLSELEKMRDPDAHRRELLPHQKHLALGIGGDIRTRIVRYRSKQETAEDYFPRFESIRDNYGNIWTPEGGVDLFTNLNLRPNDKLEFVVTASDPYGAELQYGILKRSFRDKIDWQNNNSLSIDVCEEDIGKHFDIFILIRSPRNYHAMGSYDSVVQFNYTVLPPKL